MDKIIESAKEKLADLTQSATSLFNKDVVGVIKDYSIEKLNEIWSQIEASSEVFHRTGYSVLTIDIILGIPPTMVLNLEQIENISDEEEEKLLEENKDKTILYPILVALFKANAVQKSINSVQYKFSGLTIGLGVSPSIDMKFKKVV
ncbi:MAG TPA: hypothetical protein PLU17_04010 [Chitinophagaceae bacterium]|nr:hypothetical protein [Chitinophagaceae bacterium]